MSANVVENKTPVNVVENKTVVKPSEVKVQSYFIQTGVNSRMVFIKGDQLTNIDFFNYD